MVMLVQSKLYELLEIHLKNEATPHVLKILSHDKCDFLSPDISRYVGNLYNVCLYCQNKYSQDYVIKKLTFLINAIYDFAYHNSLKQIDFEIIIISVAPRLVPDLV